MSTMMIVSFFLICLFILPSQADSDQAISKFCNRWDHMSALLNGKVYVNGGREMYASRTGTGDKQGTATLGTNNNVFTIDVSNNWNWREKTIFTSESNSTTAIPTVAGGALWGDPKTDLLYLYGGTTAGLNESFSTFSNGTDQTAVMWQYKVGEPDSWSPVKLQMEDGEGPVPRYAYGANTFVSDLRLGFWLGGREDSGTVPSTGSIDPEDGGTMKFVQDFLVFDFTSGKVRNLTAATAGLPHRARAYGQMVYIPELGEKGALVLLGGSQDTDSAGGGDTFSVASPIDLDQVAIFDLATVNDTSPMWYSQLTNSTSSSGIPLARVGFCAVSIPSQDMSSYNIHMYGGWAGTAGGNFDEMWALSLPSFTWTRLRHDYDDREYHTCHVIGQNQIMTIGGAHAANDNSNCDWELQSVAIFDTAVNNWGSKFDPAEGPYVLPRLLYQTIGGNGTGGATLKSPINGWSNPNISRLFDSAALNSTGPSNATTGNYTTPPSPLASSNGDSKSHKLGAGGIAGIVIAAVVFVIAVVAIVYKLRLPKLVAYPLPEMADDPRLRPVLNELPERPQTFAAEMDAVPFRGELPDSPARTYPPPRSEPGSIPDEEPVRVGNWV